MFGQLKGTYTDEGINKMCEGLKSSSITSLKSATSPHRHQPTPPQLFSTQ